MHFVLIGKRL